MEGNESNVARQREVYHEWNRTRGGSVRGGLT